MSCAVAAGASAWPPSARAPLRATPSSCRWATSVDFFATAQRQMLAGQLQDARERLLASFEGLSDEEMIQPGVAGQWSVRDNLAHIAAWDRAVTAGFREMLDGKRPDLIDLDDDAIDEFNLDNHRAL